MQIARAVAAPEPIVEAMKSDESIIWDFLIQSGYSPDQAAGIMGNLKQENHYSTAGDSISLGIAQWTDARREELEQRADYQRLTTQLQFLVDELNSTEKRAGDALKSSQSVDDAAIVFQNMFERCDPKWCMQSQRVGYAIEILHRYSGA